jgi:hypothetical protein
MVSMNEFEMSDDDDEIYRSISSENYNINKQEQINDLLALSSLMSYHINSDQIISSEYHLIHSKFQRLFVTDVYNEPMRHALGDQISNITEVDNALINLSRNATLKFRNYKQFREQVRLIFFFLSLLENFLQLLAASNERRNTSENLHHQSTNLRRSTSNSNTPRSFSFYSKTSLRYLLHSSFFKWFISIVICLDAVNYSL